MYTRTQVCTLSSLSSLSAVAALLLATSGIGAQPSAPAIPPTTASATRLRIHVEAPDPGPLRTGVAIIRFRTEHVHIASLFSPGAPAPDSTPAAHVHVTVDGTSWHWVHSTSDPVVIAPLTAGQHTVTLELAGADHRPLATGSVRFAITAPKVAKGHTGHR